MKEEIISFETAKLAKEKGFSLNETTGIRFFCDRDKNEILMDTGSLADAYSEIFYDETEDLLAPTQSILQRWLREKHLLHIIISPSFGHVIVRLKSVEGKNNGRFDDFKSEQGFNSYEKALESALQSALKLIKP